MWDNVVSVRQGPISNKNNSYRRYFGKKIDQFALDVIGIKFLQSPSEFFEEAFPFQMLSMSSLPIPLSTDLRVPYLLHGDQAAWGVAGERLLTVADELQTRMTGNHLLAVPEWSKCAKLVRREKN